MKFKRDYYEPSPEEIKAAEASMLDSQKTQSIEREKAFDALKPPRFDQNSGSILFDLDKRLIYTEKIGPLAVKEGFEPKDEFHLTIFGFKKGRIIKNALNAFPGSQRGRKMQEIQNLIQRTDWTLASKPKLYKVSKDYNFTDRSTGQTISSKRETIIQALDLKELLNFSNSLGQIIGKKLEPQFPHLTLFTKGADAQSRMGIGIDTLEDFQKLNPEPLEV